MAYPPEIARNHILKQNLKEYQDKYNKASSTEQKFNDFISNRFDTRSIHAESENIRSHSQKGAHCHNGKVSQNASVYQRYGTV